MKLQRAIILLVVVNALMGVLAVSRLRADVSITDKGSWPKTWPKELEPLRMKARTIEGPLAGFLSHEIPFLQREDFETAWPHFLKVRSPDYPITLVRSPHGTVKAGVVINSWPIASGDINTTTVIVIVVDGNIVDLNLIQFPENTRIQDERFKDVGITKP